MSRRQIATFVAGRHANEAFVTPARAARRVHPDGIR